jgi:hypothetical protein
MALALSGCAIPFALRQAQDDNAQGRLAQDDTLLPVGAAGTVPQGGAATQLHQDLLYVAHAKGPGSNSHGVMTVLTFPQGQHVATIPLQGFATGLCSDAAGNVWAVVYEPHDWNVYEFPHGGTKPISRIHIGHPHHNSGACSVDPTTGDLAVALGNANCGVCSGFVDIWAGARAGKPEQVRVALTPVGLSYDDSGNLFLDGYVGSTVFFALVELSKGSRAFENVVLKQEDGFPGGLAWDGQYLDVFRNNYGRNTGVYRVKVSQYQGHVVDTVRLVGIRDGTTFAIGKGLFVGLHRSGGNKVAVWPYPAGGNEEATLARFPETPRSLTISR